MAAVVVFIIAQGLDRDEISNNTHNICYFLIKGSFLLLALNDSSTGHDHANKHPEWYVIICKYAQFPRQLVL